MMVGGEEHDADDDDDLDLANKPSADDQELSFFVTPNPCTLIEVFVNHDFDPEDMGFKIISAEDQRTSAANPDMYLYSNHGEKQAFASVCLPEGHYYFELWDNVDGGFFSHDDDNDNDIANDVVNLDDDVIGTYNIKANGEDMMKGGRYLGNDGDGYQGIYFYTTPNPCVLVEVKVEYYRQDFVDDDRDRFFSMNYFSIVDADGNYYLQSWIENELQ